MISTKHSPGQAAKIASEALREEYGEGQQQEYENLYKDWYSQYETLEMPHVLDHSVIRNFEYSTTDLRLKHLLDPKILMALSNRAAGGDQASLDLLADILQDEYIKDDRKQAVINHLGRASPEMCVSLVNATIPDSSTKLMASIVNAVSKGDLNPIFLDFLEEKASKGDYSVKKEAMEGLVRYGLKGAERLANCLSSDDQEARGMAAYRIQRLGISTPEIVQALLNAQSQSEGVNKTLIGQTIESLRSDGAAYDVNRITQGMLGELSTLEGSKTSSSRFKQVTDWLGISGRGGDLRAEPGLFQHGGAGGGPSGEVEQLAIGIVKLARLDPSILRSIATPTPGPFGGVEYLIGFRNVNEIEVDRPEKREDQIYRPVLQQLEYDEEFRRKIRNLLERYPVI